MPSLRKTGVELRAKIRTLLGALNRNLSRLERWLLLVFLLSALAAATQLVRIRGAQTYVVPLAGGTYREGMLASSTRDLEVIETALTKIGLVKLGTSGALEPALATEWTISEDAQTIRLRIADGVTAERVVEILRSQSESGYWKEAEITIPEPQVVKFRLTKPWAGFVTEIVTPVFPFGPFNKTGNGKSDRLVFVRNDAALLAPYLDRVEIQLFSDARALERAVRKNLVEGVFSPDQAELSLPASWRVSQPTLKREHLLFFNLRQDVLDNSALRQRLARGERLDVTLTLRLAVPETAPLNLLAADLATRWQELNVMVSIEKYPLLTLTKTIIPERNYDLLMLGVDYGADGDLYPYWHSSQIASPGNNFAGYRNKEVDRLLDETRKLTEAGERHQRYEAARKILTDDAAFVSLGSPGITFGLAPKVKGEVPDRLLAATGRWTDIAGWYMKERRVRATSE